MRIESFSPVADRQATILVLGSMPGAKSLQEQQYYAHPRNLFWRIMGDLVGAAPELAYDARLARLKAHGIALWDVLESCVRPGSLDADIDETTLVPNDFVAFFHRHQRISRVFFNGAKAELSFRRHVLPQLELGADRRIHYVRLPSTSPAHAAMSYAQKLQKWQAIVQKSPTPSDK